MIKKDSRMKKILIAAAFAATSVFGMNQQSNDVKSNRHSNNFFEITRENSLTKAENLPKDMQEMRNKPQDAISRSDYVTAVGLMGNRNSDIVKLLLLYKNKTMLSDKQFEDFLIGRNILNSVDENGNTLLDDAVQTLIDLRYVGCEKMIDSANIAILL